MKLQDLDKSFIEKINGAVSLPSFGGDPEFFVANARGTILASDKFFPGKNCKIEFPAKESQCRGCLLYTSPSPRD